MDIDFSEVRKLSVDLERSSGTVGARASAALRKAALSIEGDAKVLAPVDTGDLAESISTDITNDGRFSFMSAEIGPTVEYGAAVEYGSAPHVIRAKDGGMLAFPGRGGGMVFVREVNHPGNAPQPFMGPAFDRNVPLFERALGAIGEDIL